MDKSGRPFIIFFFVVCVFLSLSESHTRAAVPDSLLHQRWDDNSMMYRTDPWTPGSDSIFCLNTFHRGKYYYNLDSIYHRIATNDQWDIVEDLRYFYFIVSHSDKEQQAMQRVRLVEAAKHDKSKSLRRELDVFDAYARFEYTDFLTQDIWDFFRKLIDKYERCGDRQTKLRIMHRLIWESSSRVTYDFSLRDDQERVPVIRLINEALTTLDRMDEPYIFGSNEFYTLVAHLYYDFRYYNKAIPLFWKSLENSSDNFYDRHIMKARDYLGAYCRMQGDYDLSDSLYLSVLTDPRQAFLRPIDNVIALGGLASNARLRREYDEAVRLYSAALPGALEMRDSTLAGGYAVSLGRIYLDRGDNDTTLEYLYRARQYLDDGRYPMRNKVGYYTLWRDYSLKIGNAGMGAAYIDSIAMARSGQDNVYDTRMLAYAEQEVFEIEQALKDEQLQRQSTRIKLISVILALSLFLLGLLYWYNRKLKEKNRNLYRRIKEQDRLEEENTTLRQDYEALAASLPKEAARQPEDAGKIPGDRQQRGLVESLREYLLAERNFTNEISRDELAALLGTNRSTLSDALKAVTGKTPTEYIRLMQLEEARRMLERNPEMTVEAIAWECGFNAPNTFYRQFKKHYGISPAEYRKQANSR